MSDLREAAQQALNYWESASFGDAVMVDKMDALRAALAQQAEGGGNLPPPLQADPAQNYWFEDWNGAVRSRPEDCVAWGANGRPAAVWVNKVRYTPPPVKKEEPPCP